MNAGFRWPSSALILALGASIGLHLAVLFSLDSQLTRHAKMPGIFLTRLVPSRGESLVAPRPTLQNQSSSPKPRVRRAAVPDPPKLAPPPSPVPPPAPSLSGGPDLPIDLRVREIVVLSPATYGLPEKFEVAGSELPYAWSDDIESPPSAASMSMTRYPSGADSDGLVLIRALIGTSGAIDDFEVLCGASPFEDVARESVPNWAFVPATTHGIPARAWLLLEFAFMKSNTEEGFDPSLADVALNSMRVACADRLSTRAR